MLLLRRDHDGTALENDFSCKIFVTASNDTEQC